MSAPAIADDELLLRHIPGGPTWQAPPLGRVTSLNFRLRPDETGLSVSRLSITSADELLARVGNPATGSRVAVARVGDVRAMGFDVVPVILPDDPGHAEIRPTTADLGTKAARQALSTLFQYLPTVPPPPAAA
jgi:hypothetical protein